MDFTAPKGMRDFLPAEMQKRQWAMERIRGVYQKFGFLPMETPALETVEVLEKKCGEEIRGQLFRVDDGRLALRFDLTVPLARVSSSSMFKKPFKRYCIAPVWRREEPQKGRLREFYQADADIIGCPSVRAEAELIACASEAIQELGFPAPVVRLNDRRIISAIASRLISGKEGEVLRIFDKREKIGDAACVEMLEGVGVKKEAAKKLLSELTGSSGNESRLKLAEIYSKEAAQDLKEILDLLPEYSKAIKVELDFSLVRGLDYYTGPIFELSLGKEMGSVAGGGRYDGLLSMYGQGDSAVGISLGIERLLALMKEREFEKQGVFVANAKEGFYGSALSVAAAFRKGGISALTDLNCRNLKKQVENAAGSCEWIAIVGEREIKAAKVTLRNLKTGKEELLSIEDAARKIMG